MREINSQIITETVKKLCIEANCHLTEDMKNCIKCCYENEPWPRAKEILERIIENYEIADAEKELEQAKQALNATFAAIPAKVSTQEFVNLRRESSSFQLDPKAKPITPKAQPRRSPWHLFIKCLQNLNTMDRMVRQFTIYFFFSRQYVV